MIPHGRIRKDDRALRGYAVADSSNVLYVGWLPKAQVMVVWYGKPRYPESTTVYQYLGVSRQRVVAAALAPSVGTYINREIKPRYMAVKIS